MENSHCNKRHRIEVFRALLKTHNLYSLRLGGLVLFSICILFISFANQAVLLTPTSAILYSLGGTIPRTSDSLSLSLQILPILIALLVWGKYLNNELCFRCQLILPKCQSLSVWYLSLLVGMGLYSVVLSIIGLLASGLGGFLFQEIFYRLGMVDSVFCLPLMEYTDSKIPFSSISSIIIVFALFALRLMILLLFQYVSWLITAKMNISLLISLFFAAISVYNPNLLYMPVGGTMFFGNLIQNGGVLTGIMVALFYFFVLGMGGWLYCMKADWLMKFNH
jgi:hypothetical protein